MSTARITTLTVQTQRGSVTCGYLVIATHVPLQGNTGVLGAALFQSKLSLYTSYAIGAKLPRNALPSALFWDTSEPYQYLRVEDHPQASVRYLRRRRPQDRPGR